MGLKKLRNLYVGQASRVKYIQVLFYFLIVEKPSPFWLSGRVSQTKNQFLLPLDTERKSSLSIRYRHRWVSIFTLEFQRTKKNACVLNVLEGQDWSEGQRGKSHHIDARHKWFKMCAFVEQFSTRCCSFKIYGWSLQCNGQNSSLPWGSANSQVITGLHLFHDFTRIKRTPLTPRHIAVV